jgi:hypothetical protein
LLILSPEKTRAAFTAALPLRALTPDDEVHGSSITENNGNAILVFKASNILRTAWRVSTANSCTHINMIEGEQLTSGNTRYNIFEPSPVLHTINNDDSEKGRRRKTHEDDIKQLTDKYEVIYKEMNVQRKNPGKWQILWLFGSLCERKCCIAAAR